MVWVTSQFLKSYLQYELQKIKLLVFQVLLKPTRKNCNSICFYITVRILVISYHGKNTRPSRSTVQLETLKGLKDANLCLYVCYNIRKPSCYESKILIGLGADKLKFEMKSNLFLLYILSTWQFFPNFSK